MLMSAPNGSCLIMFVVAEAAHAIVDLGLRKRDGLAESLSSRIDDCLRNDPVLPLALSDFCLL